MDRNQLIGVAGGTAAVAGGALGVAEIQRRRHNAKALAGHAFPSRGGIVGGTPPLSHAEQKALRAYATQGYIQVQEKLRTGRYLAADYAKGALVESNAAKGVIDDVISGVSGATERGNIRSGTLFRGVGYSVNPGDVITDVAFTSTSKKASVANQFARVRGGSGRGTIMVIDAKGARGVDMGKLSGYGYEKEVLLGRGAQMEVGHVARGVRRHIFDFKGTDVAFARVAGAADDVPAVAAKAARFGGRALKAAGLVAGVGVGLYALARGASAKEAAYQGADMATGGALSDYSAHRAAGHNAAESIIGATASYATFGILNAEHFVKAAEARKGTQKTARKRNERRRAMSKGESATLRAKKSAVEMQQRKAKAQKAAKAEAPDGYKEAYAARGKGGKVVRYDRRRMSAAEMKR